MARARKPSPRCEEPTNRLQGAPFICRPTPADLLAIEAAAAADVGVGRGCGCADRQLATQLAQRLLQRKTGDERHTPVLRSVRQRRPSGARSLKGPLDSAITSIGSLPK